ncbi:MAG: hypothetical protein AVDCRST_MAG51-2349, partial [uncultured Ramlibacter sp.]
CPVDCIALENVTQDRTGWQAWSPEQAAEALERYVFRKQRLAREETEQQQRLESKAEAKLADLPGQTHGAEGAEEARKRAIVEAALARARARRRPV